MGTSNITGTGWSATMAANSAAIGTSFTNIGNYLEPDLQTSSTTSYDSSTTTRTQAQDGYTSGYLLEISVDTNGVITGTYSKRPDRGPLGGGPVCSFANEDGLQRQGGQPLLPDPRLGRGRYGHSGTSSLGTINSNNPGASNVDMATQMVQMITPAARLRRQQQDTSPRPTKCSRP
jgi:flagellar hook protein FlgE